MANMFDDWETRAQDRPRPRDYAYDLDGTFSSLVAITARIPQDAWTAAVMGTERRGNGVLIRDDGLILTISYLVADADQVWLTTNDGRVVHGHVVDNDAGSGLALVQADDDLGVAPMALGGARGLAEGDRVVVGAAGGRRRSIAAAVVGRHEFAGYWEYVLDDAIFTAPVHPFWGGTALIGPDGALLGIGSLRLETRYFTGKVLPINMMVPIDLATPLIERLQAPEAPRPQRPWLGVFAHESDDDVVLSGTAGNGPADRAGLRQGDVVVAVAGEAVTSLADFYRRIWALGAAGVDVPLTLNREGDIFDVAVRSRDRSQMRGPVKNNEAAASRFNPKR